MNPDEYAAGAALISAQVSRYVQQFAKLFALPALTLVEWLRLLELVFPEIQRQRGESAVLARRFYDSQRELHYPELPRNDRLLEGTNFENFVKSMEPARRRMSQADSQSDAVTHMTLQALREVENAGRRQIISAVEEDPGLDVLAEAVGHEDLVAADKAEGPKILRGWARVATGRETCAWCLMLISRGPTYLGSDTAGLDIDSSEAEDEFRKAGADLQSFFDFADDFMEEWHPGCDCKVVPVYKAQDWPGRAEYKRAEDAWIQASKDAKAYREEHPDRVHLAGENKGKPFTLNEDTINALRRRLSSGDISMSEFSALAA